MRIRERRGLVMRMISHEVSVIFFFLSLSGVVYIYHLRGRQRRPHLSGLIYSIDRRSIHHSASLISLFADIPLSASIHHTNIIPRYHGPEAHNLFPHTYYTHRMSLLSCTHGAHAAGGSAQATCLFSALHLQEPGKAKGQHPSLLIF